MCFGAGPSFSASIVLGVAGIGALRRVRERHEFAFAAIPLVFALHQLNEGMLWLVLTDRAPANWQQGLNLGFLLVALALWPTYAPLANYKLEPQSGRRRLILPFVVLGLLTSAYLLFFLLKNSFSSSIHNCSLYYDFHVPGPQHLVLIYIAVVAGHFLFSSFALVRFFGAAVMLFCALSLYLYTHTFVSSWCFFASILSAMVAYFFYKRYPLQS
ncbi:MAG: hypothetical protein K1X79_13725 [Oligoflexia bacterium]|nr:hypothetical protein [Oligoflexia bacterium]